jgi:uncharacterized protein
MIVKRDLSIHLQRAAALFPVVAVLGPRQSGKTTLVQEVFPHHTYISLEDIDIRALALADPRRFLQDFTGNTGIILDEIQNVPELLSYMQTIVDREKKNGYFVVTGSQNLLINQAITQTLAGRIALLHLFPFSIHELAQAHLLSDKIEDVIFKGSYPRAYAQQIPPDKLYNNYISTYIERDVRQIKNITDLNTFQRFLQMCAGRTGQLLNLTSLGNDCGIDHKTARAWISVLEASYTVFLLYPHHKNYGKRLIKAPKLYFVDTGIACALLRIKSPEDLTAHYLRGNLVETFIISDLYKQFYNIDQKPALYFWRDQTGHEVDIIIEQALKLVPIEIKASKTVVSDYFEQLTYWSSLARSTSEKYVIYAGDTNQQWPHAQVLNWQSSGNLIAELENSD